MSRFHLSFDYANPVRPGERSNGSQVVVDVETLEDAARRIACDRGVSVLHVKKRFQYGRPASEAEEINRTFDFGMDDRAKRRRAYLEQRRDRLQALEAAQEERDQLKADRENYDAIEAELSDTLGEVRYWLHDVLVFGRIPRNPLALLRRVERTLEP